MQACERCHSRKTRCDRRVPRCTSCAKSQVLCKYPNRRRDRQQYLMSIESRLQELEQENEQLRGNTQSRPQSAAEQDDSPQLPQITPPTRPTRIDEPRHTETQQSPTTWSSCYHRRTPGEEARYLGSSNGAEFVDVVERVVDSNHAGGLFGQVTDSHRTPDRLALPSVSQPAVLVDKAIAMSLIDSYFAHWHLTFPLLHQPAFMRMAEHIYSDPAVYQHNTTCAFAFDIVLALGSVPSTQIELGFTDAESHFARAVGRLDQVSSLRDIRSLQALLLYCKYSIHASLRDTSSDIWEALGRATRLVVEIGLYLDSSTPLPRCKAHITDELPASLQVEMQRQTFWCYYNLDR